MRTNSGWAGPRRMALALALAAVAGSARADSMTTTGMTGMTTSTPVSANITYNTSGLVGSTGITGKPVISFAPVSNSGLYTPSSLSLGTFVVAPLPDGQTTVYNHTPFAISYATQSINGQDQGASPPLLTIQGFLNGTVTGSDQSNVVATFEPISNSTAAIGTLYTGTLSLPSPQRSLVPSTTFGGQSTAEGFIIVNKLTTTPEPTTVALFLAAGAGLGLRRRLKARASRA